MSVFPESLQMADDETLEIRWSDGDVRRYRVRELRDSCPCATCREKRKSPPPSPTSLPVLTAAEIQPLRIASMQPTGRYAYSIHFSDGHDTGLYTIDSLRELGTLVE